MSTVFLVVQLAGGCHGAGLLSGQLAGQLCSLEKDGPGDGNWRVLPLGSHPDSSNIITGFENLIFSPGSRFVPLSTHFRGKKALTAKDLST